MKLQKIQKYLSAIQTGDIFMMKKTEYGIKEIGGDYYYDSFTKKEIDDILYKRWSRKDLAIAYAFPEENYIIFQIYDKKGRNINEVEMMLDGDNLENAEYFKSIFKMAMHTKRHLKERLDRNTPE